MEIERRDEVKIRKPGDGDASRKIVEILEPDSLCCVRDLLCLPPFVFDLSEI